MASHSIGLDTIRQTIGGGGSFDPTDLKNELLEAVAEELDIIQKQIPTLDVNNGAFVVGNRELSGKFNTAILSSSKFSQPITGPNNVLIGNDVLNHTEEPIATSGSVVIGQRALGPLHDVTDSVVVGREAGYFYTTGPVNRCVGIGARVRLGDNPTNRIAIGYNAVTENDNTTQIGNDTTDMTIYCGDKGAVALRSEVPRSNARNNFLVESSNKIAHGGGSTDNNILMCGAKNTMHAANNVVIGYDTANSMTTENFLTSTLIGNSVLPQCESSVDTVAIGYRVQAGKPNHITGSVAIGVRSGFVNSTLPNDTGVISNRIAIGCDAQCENDATVQIGDNDKVMTILCGKTGPLQFASGSDTRLKEDIHPADLELCKNAVLSLPVTRYKYKDFTGEQIDTHVTGWMADDVEKVFPKSVRKLNKSFREIDENGKPTLDEDGKPKRFMMTDVKHIVMTEATPTLWGALQQAFLEIAQMKQEIASLKYQMTLLKQK